MVRGRQRIKTILIARQKTVFILYVAHLDGMGRGYTSREVRQRLISALGNAGTAMSGVELAEKTGINRVTLTKYLGIFAAEGLVRQRSSGNITLWSLEPGQEDYDFPGDYFRAASQYMDLLAKGTEEQVYALVRNCLHSGGGAGRLVAEVVLPAIRSVADLFESGKIGSAERNLLRNTISKSLHMLEQSCAAGDPGKNVVLVAADPDSGMLSAAASAMYHADGWRVSHLGNMSDAADMLFDLDFQKLVGRIWRQKPGILLVVVFSGTGEGLRFFADSINAARQKSGKQIRLALCGKLPKKPGNLADLVAEDVEDIVQWSRTVGDGLKS